jgi:hypothetical protein
MNPMMVARVLEGDPNVEYAEPVYVRRLAVVPNDPMYSQQYHLPQIHAPEAWDVQKVDSTVIIGIVDTGVDYDHEDLAANVWTNELEASGVTGMDDDGNGKVDDIHGWDFGEDDSDPTDPSDAGHGSHCAGIACAVTNNQIGIAGVSWNGIYMPVKVTPDNTEEIWNGCDGIVYAADNGADVISNSWLGMGYMKSEQEKINYAHSKGAIIVFAAGNYDNEMAMYPACYQHVISVAAVKANDTKASYSNFGPWIDICAPGGDRDNGILSTLPDEEYASWFGTSMATPVVAGVCGLVKSLHPDWSNDQIIRQALLTADNIDAYNPQYVNRLGHGRVNAFHALTDTLLQEPDARLVLLSSSVSDSLTGNNSGVFERGETIQLRCNIQNSSIGGTESAVLRLSSASTNIEILNGIVNPPYFPADTILSFEFSAKISDNALAEVAEMILTLETSKGYFREEKVEISVGKMPVLLVDHDQPVGSLPDVEPFYRSILNGDNILFGYWDVLQGGFPGPEVLSDFPIVILSSVWLGNLVDYEELYAVKMYLEGGGNLFICGQDIGEGLFEYYGTEEAKSFMRDYLHAEYIAMDSEDQEVMGVVDDIISHDMSFHVWQPGYHSTWQSPEVIAPTTGATTIFTYSDGRTAAVKYAGDHKVVYIAFGLEAVDSDESTQIGDPSPIRTELLRRTINWLNFIEHKPLTNTVTLDSPRTIHARITGNVTDLQAVTLFWRLQGSENFTMTTMTENDSMYYSAEIPAQDSGATVEYYLQTEHSYYNWHSPIGAPDTVYSYKVGEVITNVEEVTTLPAEFQLKQNYPNPFNPTTNIEFALPQASTVTLKIYNNIGQLVETPVSERLSAGRFQVTWDAGEYSSGIYFYQLQSGNYIEIRKMIFMK